MNASKSESRLVIATISLLPTIGRQTYVGGISRHIRSPGTSLLHFGYKMLRVQLAIGSIPIQWWGVKSLADDLVAGHGVVLSRAASTLRSVETQPLIG